MRPSVGEIKRETKKGKSLTFNQLFRRKQQQEHVVSKKQNVAYFSQHKLHRLPILSIEYKIFPH